MDAVETRLHATEIHHRPVEDILNIVMLGPLSMSSQVATPSGSPPQVMSNFPGANCSCPVVVTVVNDAGIARRCRVVVAPGSTVRIR
eukprot:SAG31_NODE_23952_length_492_cov_1.081425_1_plen_86_part_01